MEKKKISKWGWIASIFMLAIIGNSCSFNGNKEKKEDTIASQQTEAESPKDEQKKEDSILRTYKTDNASSTTNGLNHHEYVDLGLPSGVKWATCNVGASSPSDYGNYYAWGETTTKFVYTEENSETCLESLDDISGDPEYDAACANWGGSWRLPSKAECEELENKCTWIRTSQGGHNGYKVTGPNGNSIFLPAAGYRDGASLFDAEDGGYYWSSTPSSTRSACQFCHYSSRYSSHDVTAGFRIYGRSVRPVSN